MRDDVRAVAQVPLANCNLLSSSFFYLLSQDESSSSSPRMIQFTHLMQIEKMHSVLTPQFSSEDNCVECAGFRLVGDP